MAHELLEEGPGSSSEEECSEAERKDGSDAETLLGDDDSGMEEDTSSTTAASSQPRPLPLAGGVHASQSSYLRSPSSQLLVGSQES